MVLMISTFHLKVKKGLDIGLVLLSTVVIHSPIRSLMLKPQELFIEVPSGPELLRIPIKGLLMMEGRKIISLTPSPSNIQPHCQMLESQTNLIPQLFTSDQGMMMAQPQASLYQNSTQRILLEGLSCYPMETRGRDKGKSH